MALSEKREIGSRASCDDCHWGYTGFGFADLKQASTEAKAQLADHNQTQHPGQQPKGYTSVFSRPKN